VHVYLSLNSENAGILNGIYYGYKSPTKAFSGRTDVTAFSGRIDVTVFSGLNATVTALPDSGSFI
jgi:hypothetical protein